MNLANALAITPFLQDLYDQDVSVFVVDNEKVLLSNINPNLDIGVREGHSMEEYKQSGAYQALTTGKRIVTRVEELSATSKNMDSETVAVQKEITHVTNITSEIKKISNQSNILGINASIEAARAGENGRGFTVVAQEIRKLADETKDSAKNIEEDVQSMQNSITALLESVKQLATVSEVQAIGVTELTQAIGHISDLAEQLVAKGKK